MNREIKEAKSFFHSQAFADGLRTTVAILLPALIGFQTNYKTVGLTISLGALCVSITDAPGPGLHKRNGMLFCALFIFLVAGLTGIAKSNDILMGLAIALVCFVFSMLSVYGNRATAVGSAAILVMILTMDDPTIAGNIGFHSSLIMMGGLWYMVISILATVFRPYRLAQRTLGDCIRDIAAYLRIKTGFYKTGNDIESVYRQLVNQQVAVHEKLDATREVLFKTRATVKESTPMGRKLVMTFVEAVDFFEDTTATYYDYASLRSRFEDTGVLEKIAEAINDIAGELDSMGMAIQMNAGYRPATDLNARLISIKEAIDALKGSGQSSLVLKKILVNLRNLVQRLDEMKVYFGKGDVRSNGKSLDHSHFVTHQPLGADVFWNNLNIESAAFRHSVRVTAACLIGYVLVKWFNYGSHSYWVLLTIAFILKPAFSLTKQRNKERLLGTVIGGVIGIIILILIPNKTTLFIIMVVFMISTYSFLRTNYLAMVVSVTPFVLILFSFLGMAFLEVFQERILDTIIGCAIAFPVSYFLFPSWESGQLAPHVKKVIEANINYLDKVILMMKGKKIELLDYKLARKEVYVNTANLAALFQRMLSEPKSKQRYSDKVHEFVVMNTIFFSNIATISGALWSREPREYPKPLIIAAERTAARLKDALYPVTEKEAEKTTTSGSAENIIHPDDLLLKDQLDYLARLAKDISKTSRLIAA